MKLLKDKVVAITGAGGGMGQELIKSFELAGAKVVVIDATNQTVAAGLAVSTAGAFGVPIDISSESSVEEGFSSILRRYGHIDTLVCAAGVRPMANLIDMNLTDWNKCLSINTTGLFLCNRVVARHMVEFRSGSIINIASVNGVRAVTGMGAYNASKAAVISITQTLACELASKGVRVNAILPAQVETPMIAEQVGEERQRREERIPMGRYGKPHEIASVAIFLASDDASFVTGHSMAVDGGYLALGFMPKIYH